MIRNMGKFDTIVRLLVAAAAAGLYHEKIITGFWGAALMALAGVLVVTGLFRFCPLYLPFGIRTNGKECC